ncbi:hypothetical protein DLAC_06527 [Tieghemostelium lacteum]|uniref:Methyltransferase domain-containing protein n=1 Tax=Tieghemostelium lacteum TaxID=361077 RepID=A0A151ZF31_TIELA|nr:hypothetical protein DLAC_06527 [Tieghemostelium lacteum]|eukprot:KYQ92535.1 hypothetical protein DLAC_06527 [Tieghemostelium lacteum]
MAQNIYDDAKFFKNYSNLDRSTKGYNGTFEWPYLRDLLGDIKGKKILDLGTGFGWFCRESIKEMGAKEALGVDISENMLTRAKELTVDEVFKDKIRYQRQDLENIDLGDEKFDLVFSIFVCHYIKNIENLFRHIYDHLNVGGEFEFSIEHPIFTCCKHIEPNFIPLPGSSNLIWPVSHYNNEGDRVTNWLAEGVIKQHRTVATYVNTLIKVGFTITHLQEWYPTEEQIKANPNANLHMEIDRPLILILKVKKN